MIGRVSRRMNREDAGFTLIELLVAVVIISLITLPLGNFVIEYMRNLTSTSDRMSDSHDIQIATAYFSADAASTGLHSPAAPYDLQQSVWTKDFPASYCGQGLGVVRLLLRWDSWALTTSSGAPTGSNSPASAAYVVEGATLHRIYCASDAITSSDVTLVHGLQSVSASCALPTACESPAPPTTISLALQISTGSQDQAAPAAPIVLTGQRRQS